MRTVSNNLRKTQQELMEDIERLQRQISKLKLAASGRISGVSLKDRVAESYRTVVEDQTEMISRHLPNGILTFVNRAYCQYQGKTRKELISTNFFSRLVFPVDGEDRRIEIEQETGAGFWEIEHLYSQMIVQSVDVPDYSGVCSFQKASQTAGVGKRFETNDSLKSTIALKNFDLI